MLERWFPNLYGWLVWGGGLYLIHATLKWLAFAGAVLAVFYLGRWSV